MYNSILVTTTNIIEGNEISEYLGIVKSHCTAGIGFFGDFAAGLTDFFGGRSGTYERQMKLIDDEVISGLVENAKSLGADAIIGLHLDNDQISGKGTQMLMVTAYGTAVKLKHSISASTTPGVISRNIIENIERKSNIIEKSLKLPFDYQANDWDFIFREKIFEIADKVINNLEYWEASTFESARDKIELCKTYFLRLGDQCKEILYTSLKNKPRLKKIIFEIIKIGHYGDYHLINSILKDSNFEEQKAFLELVKFDKNEYTKNDIEEIKNLIKTIESIFPQKSTIVEEKSMLSKKVQEKWQCECGNRNSIASTYCSKCGKDQFGFDRLELNKEKSIKFLKNRLSIIENILIQ